MPNVPEFAQTSRPLRPLRRFSSGPPAALCDAVPRSRPQPLSAAHSGGGVPIYTATRYPSPAWRSGYTSTAGTVRATDPKKSVTGTSPGSCIRKTSRWSERDAVEAEAPGSQGSPPWRRHGTCPSVEVRSRHRCGAQLGGVVGCEQLPKRDLQSSPSSADAAAARPAPATQRCARFQEAQRRGGEAVDDGQPDGHVRVSAPGGLPQCRAADREHPGRVEACRQGRSLRTG